MSVLQIEKFETHGTKFANISVTYFSNGVQDLVLNITIQNNYVVRKLIGYLKIHLPESSEDKEFKKEYLRLTVDHEKLFNGVVGGFIMRSFMENVKSSLDMDIKFPIRKVKIFNAKSVNLSLN